MLYVHLIKKNIMQIYFSEKNIIFLTVQINLNGISILSQLFIVPENQL